MRWRQRAYSRPLTHTHTTRQLYVSMDMGKQGQEQNLLTFRFDYHRLQALQQAQQG